MVSNGAITISLEPTFEIRERCGLSTSTRKDTVTVYQYGAVEELFYVPAGSVLVYNGTEENEIATAMNVPLNTVDVRLAYSGGNEWIKKYSEGDIANKRQASKEGQKNFEIYSSSK